MQYNVNFLLTNGKFVTYKLEAELLQILIKAYNNDNSFHDDVNNLGIAIKNENVLAITYIAIKEENKDEESNLPSEKIDMALEQIKAKPKKRGRKPKAK